MDASQRPSAPPPAAATAPRAHRSLCPDRRWRRLGRPRLDGRHAGAERHGSRAQAAPARRFASPSPGRRRLAVRRASARSRRQTWQAWDGRISAGSSCRSRRSAGPHDVRGGLAWGFADTPLGALLAAVNIGVRANAQWGPDVFGPTIRDQVTGPDAAALLAELPRPATTRPYGPTGVPAGQSLGRAYVTEEAFRWVAYTPVDATVDIVSAGPGDQGTTVRAVTRIEVRVVGHRLAGDRASRR